MSKSAIHLVQIGFLKPIIDKVKNDGIDIDKIVHNTGLDRFQLYDSEGYIPVNIVYDALTALEKEKSIDNFLSYFMPTMKLVSMTRITDAYAFRTDLLAACRMAEAYDQVLFTHERMSLSINGRYSKFSSCFVDRPLPGRELLELLNLALILNGFRLACGQHWLPLEIHLQHDSASYLMAFLPKDHTVKVLTQQNSTAIIFPTSLLKLPMLGERTQDNQIDDILFFPLLLSQKIVQLFESNALEYLPNLTHISKLNGVSTRSIQRQLKYEGTSYREIVDNWRFKRSIFLLNNVDLPIKYISMQLGYTDVSNFERAFRRWTDNTPQHYRKVYLS